MELVSIGIPTFNRPDGLKSTLESITRQNYRNLEIIVSDNASSGDENEKVVKGFDDKRIIFYKQTTNIGAFNNFKFVLEKATGEYFMWAADDDEWSYNFIDQMMGIIDNHSGAFCNYCVKAGSSIKEVIIQESASGDNKYEQARSFLSERVPSMIYGLYKRKQIKWFSETDLFFDWFDCFFILKMILLHDGIIISKENLYTAGMGEVYEYKPVKPKKGRVFTYKPYLRASAKVIFISNVPLFKKIKLLAYLLEVNFLSYLEIEKMRKNYKIYLFLYRIYHQLMPKIFIRRKY